MAKFSESHEHRRMKLAIESALDMVPQYGFETSSEKPLSNDNSLNLELRGSRRI